MIIDTGEYNGLAERVAEMEATMTGLAERVEQGMTAEAILRRAGLMPAGRHARPRRDRHGLRLAEGGQQ